MEKSDYELITECLGGNQDAFAVLVARYKKFIYSIVYKYFKDIEDVNDISQEVFLKIYKSLDRYNPQFKFSTWSAKITVNLCLDILRKKRGNLVPMDEVENLLREYNTPELAYFEKEKTLQIQDAINKLPEKYKSLVILYHENGISYKEMSETLKQPMSIIKNRLHTARLMLKKSMICAGSNY